MSLPELLGREAVLFVEDGFEDTLIAAGVTLKERWYALGKLLDWGKANARYCRVEILCKKDGDISATYRDSDGYLTYEILAVLGETGVYSYHS